MRTYGTNALSQCPKRGASAPNRTAGIVPRIVLAFGRDGTVSCERIPPAPSSLSEMRASLQLGDKWVRRGQCERTPPYLIRGETGDRERALMARPIQFYPKGTREVPVEPVLPPLVI